MVIVAVLPTIILRDFTPANELRYLSIADEALRNHVFFSFTNQGVPYADKPPLYLWIVMLCRWVAGQHCMWLLSLFSLIPALGTVAVMDRWTRDELGGDSRGIARVLTVTGGLYLACALTIRMDMLMTFFIVLALRESWRMMQGHGRIGACRLRFALYVFLAVFTKGPLGILIPLCGTAAYVLIAGKIEGRARLFFRVWHWQAWAVMLLLCAGWFGATYAEGGPAYLDNLLFHQTVGRAVNSFHHDKPFYYYAVCIWYVLAPWSLLVIGVFVAALRRKVVKSDLQRFFMAIAATTFVLLSCISSKLQIYILPAIPFFSYTAAMFVPRFRQSPWLKASLAVPAAVFALALPAALVAARMGGPDYLSNVMVIAGAAALTIAGAWALYTIFRPSAYTPARAIRRIGGGLLAAVFLAAFAFPQINKEIGFRDLCEEALQCSRQHGSSDFKTWHISRPEGMDVYLQREVTVVPKDTVPAASAKGFVLMTKKKYADSFRGMPTKTVGPYAVVWCQSARQQPRK